MKPLIKFGFNKEIEEPGSNKSHEGDYETTGCHFLRDVRPYEMVAVGQQCNWKDVSGKHGGFSKHENSNCGISTL